jgi:hypothetical protein
MQVVQVKCPKCGNPIISKQKDTVFYCTNCGTMHIRNGGVQILDIEIGDFNKNATQDRVYVPFWRMYSTVVINNIRTEGGGFHKLASWLRGEGNSSNMFIWIPASEMEIDRFKGLAVDLTLNLPPYVTRMDFGTVPRLPTVVKQAEAMEMADFVVVTIEAEKPGVLQNLDYTLTVQDAKMIYLPFVSTQRGLVPAF